jgi:6-pyruvoyltetrahydropterin/6-carboxytetrahydropterin synthase
MLLKGGIKHMLKSPSKKEGVSRFQPYEMVYHKQPMTISKSFTWDAAHRLIKGYPGKCQSLHGHRYTCKVTLMGEPSNLNKYDMLFDFTDLKFLKKWLDENWDHATIVADCDKSLIKFLKDEKQRYYIVKDNPTAENMCKILYSLVFSFFDESSVRVKSITVWETPSSEATLDYTKG